MLLRKADNPQDLLDTGLVAVNWLYGDNLEFNNLTVLGPSRARFTLRVKDSRGPGARRSWSGRRTVAACWHVHKHFLLAVLGLQPDAVVQTVMAKYEGLQGFRDTYPGTRDINVGSMMRPAYMPELCDCEL